MQDALIPIAVMGVVAFVIVSLFIKKLFKIALIGGLIVLGLMIGTGQIGIVGTVSDALSGDAVSGGVLDRITGAIATLVQMVEQVL